MYAIYSNSGTLDIRALTVMGINSKPNSDSPIGFFGTGLKYAIAVLIRNGCSIGIYDGNGNEYIVTAESNKFRDKDFTMLRLQSLTETSSSHNLPFTTELGKKWELWMALRELESNMRDEGGEFTLSQTAPTSEPNRVHIIVSGDKFINCVRNERSTVFYDLAVEDAQVNKLQGIEYAQRETRNIYYRGILVGTVPEGKKLRYTYNVTDLLDLTEDRTLKYQFEWDMALRVLFTHKAPMEYVRDVLNNNANDIKHGEFPTYSNGYRPEVVHEMIEATKRGAQLPKQMQQIVMRAQIEAEMNRAAALDDNAQEMLQEAITRLIASGYPVDMYEIHPAQQLPDGALGLADYNKNRIMISQRCFEEGLENVMGTLLEEFAHLHYNYTDNSRTFQDWLLRQTIVNIQRNLRNQRIVRELPIDVEKVDD